MVGRKINGQILFGARSEKPKILFGTRDEKQKNLFGTKWQLRKNLFGSQRVNTMADYWANWALLTIFKQEKMYPNILSSCKIVTESSAGL